MSTRPTTPPAAPGILYFLPGVGGGEVLADPRGVIARAGLVEQLGESGKGIHHGAVANGPGGLRGVTIAREPTPFAYSPDQKWEEHPLQLATEECPEPGSVWLCLLGNPGPEHLQRPELIAGHDVQLGDGRVWTVPVLRSAEGIIRLPKKLRLGKGGTLVGAVAPRYVALWEQAQKVWNLLIGDDGVPFGELWPFACSVLGLNYRIGQPDISALGLFDSDNLVKVAEAALDVPSMRIIGEDAQKKSPEPVS